MMEETVLRNIVRDSRMVTPDIFLSIIKTWTIKMLLLTEAEFLPRVRR